MADVPERNDVDVTWCLKLIKPDSNEKGVCTNSWDIITCAICSAFDGRANEFRMEQKSKITNGNDAVFVIRYKSGATFNTFNKQSSAHACLYGDMDFIDAILKRKIKVDGETLRLEVTRNYLPRTRHYTNYSAAL